MRCAADYLGNVSQNVYLYDIRGCDLESSDLSRQLDAELRSRTHLAGSWQHVYKECDLIITCTVSKERYIDIPPSAGSLLLDVSLRDFKSEAISGIKAIVVDDWDEVCRENTDIELLHLQRGLTKDQTMLFD